MIKHQTGSLQGDHLSMFVFLPKKHISSPTHDEEVDDDEEVLVEMDETELWPQHGWLGQHVWRMPRTYCVIVCMVYEMWGIQKVYVVVYF